MKWIVFVLGFILALGGLFAISQGYDIIDVERGWTLVIAGTTAFSAGIIAICMGFVIARIDLLIRLAVQEPTPAAVDELPPARFAPAPVRPPFDEAAEAAVAAAMELQRHAGRQESVPTDAAFAAGESFSAPEVDPPEEQEADLADFSFANPGNLPPVDADVAPFPIKAAPISIKAAAIPVKVAPRSVNVTTASLPDDAAKLHRAQMRAPLVAPPRIPVKTVPAPGPWPAEPPRPPIQIEEFAPMPKVEAQHIARGNELDWLERELARTGPDEAIDLMPRPQQLAHTGALEQPEREEREEESEDASSPEENPAVPVIIGRYESNGASYILFNDGSIEAETDDGVYRFASMAELKSFVEARA